MKLRMKKTHRLRGLRLREYPDRDDLCLCLQIHSNDRDHRCPDPLDLRCPDLRLMDHHLRFRGQTHFWNQVRMESQFRVRMELDLRCPVPAETMFPMLSPKPCKKANKMRWLRKPSNKPRWNKAHSEPHKVRKLLKTSATNRRAVQARVVKKMEAKLEAEVLMAETAETVEVLVRTEMDSQRLQTVVLMEAVEKPHPKTKTLSRVLATLRWMRWTAHANVAKMLTPNQNPM